MERRGTPSRPLIIAHRGASAYAPENTIAAFQMAIDEGADGVELDVQLAKDGVPVIIHDYTLRRTGGRRDRVGDLTSKQLGQIDVGSWFNANHRKRARAEFQGETVPTLEAVLKLLGGFDSLIYAELKCESANFRPLVAAVADRIRLSPLLPRIIVQSFRLAAISEVRCRLPAVQTAALFEPSITTILRRRSQTIAIAREFGAHRLSLHHTLVTPRLSSLANQSGMPVAVWTVDDPRWIGRCQKLGIGGLITNDPARLVAARFAGKDRLQNP